jgi:DNA polymerase III epsilon subunit-like protein
MQQPNIRFNNVALLAKRLGKHIGIYDLESTTFRGVPQFAITEVYCFFVSPEGKGAAIGSLINPERPISAKAEEITGITHEMTKDQETWSARFATMFENMAAGECWVTGFNNATFDNRAVMDMNRRYGKPIEAFKYTFDVRTLHLKLSRAKSTAGTLSQVSQLYGVFPKGNLHRAQADVALTVELLDAILAKYGIETVAQFIENTALASESGAPANTATPPAKPTAPTRVARPKPIAPALIDYVRGKSFVSMEMLEEALQIEARTLSFEIGRAIDERTVDPFTFAVAPAQDWLTQNLVELDTETLTQGKLKPIHDALAAGAPEGHLDYVQLRIALLSAGQSWTTLKPS